MIDPMTALAVLGLRVPDGTAYLVRYVHDQVRADPPVYASVRDHLTDQLLTDLRLPAETPVMLVELPGSLLVEADRRARQPDGDARQFILGPTPDHPPNMGALVALAFPAHG